VIKFYNIGDGLPSYDTFNVRKHGIMSKHKLQHTYVYVHIHTYIYIINTSIYIHIYVHLIVPMHAFTNNGYIKMSLLVNHIRIDDTKSEELLFISKLLRNY
jgi:hypothetical protein